MADQRDARMLNYDDVEMDGDSWGFGRVYGDDGETYSDDAIIESVDVESATVTVLCVQCGETLTVPVARFGSHLPDDGPA